MRLLCFSDWRVQPIQAVYRFVRNLAEPPDFILYAGDDLVRFFEEGVNHFSQLAQYTRQHRVLVVAGNDDIQEVKVVLSAPNVHDLYYAPLIHEQFAFLGVEASTSGPALLRHSEEEVERHLLDQWRTVKDKAIIILSHTPPHGILDLGIRFAPPEEGAHHIGSTALRDFVIKRRVKLVVCGHCHSQGRLSANLRNTVVVNVSSHDSPGAPGNFALINLNYSSLLNLEFHDTSEQIAANSLLNLHGVGYVTESALSHAGITTVKQLTQAQDLYKISDSSGIPLSTLRKLKVKARSLCDNKMFQVEDFKPIKGDVILFDIETDLACNRVWLMGAYTEGRFCQFYANSWAEEKEILADFLNFLSSHPKSKLVSFSGTNFDKNVVEKALKRLKLDFRSFQSHMHFDMCQQIRECFIFPNQSYALKDLASFLAYKFKYPELCGLLVALEYHRHIQDEIPLDPKIFEYNEDDVRALLFIMDTIENMDQAEKSSIPELTISDDQKRFRDYVADLKRKGIAGAEYREKIAEWTRKHKKEIT